MITNSIAGIQVSPEAMGSIQMIALKVGLGFIELNVDAASSSDPDSSGSHIGDEQGPRISKEPAGFSVVLSQ